jgi:hypothetical protein
MSENCEAAQFGDIHPQGSAPITPPVHRLDDPTDQAQATILRAQQAWHRLRHAQTWEDWKEVGAALLIGRSGVMHDVSVNRPIGRRYNAAFATWLKKFDFENLDKADRSRLFGVMDHLQDIEAWRATLTPSERLRLNHPSAVWRKWKSAHANAQNQDSRLSPIEKCRQEKRALKQEIVRLRRKCERLDGDRWQSADRPDEIATVLLAKLSANKAAAVAGAILKALEGKVAE